MYVQACMLNLIRKIIIKVLNWQSCKNVEIQNYFCKSYVPNWSEEVFVIKKYENTVPQRYVISDLKGEVIVGTFYEKKLQKTNQKKF